MNRLGQPAEVAELIAFLASERMVSLNPYSINGFGKVHTVDTNVPGGLGYTYPNPMQLKDKLWLFWRGGAWTHGRTSTMV